MKTNISLKLKSLIKKRGITFKELSHITWISQQQLSVINKWKSKKIEFTTIYKLLKGLVCSPNDLFFIDNKDGKEETKVWYF